MNVAHGNGTDDRRLEGPIAIAEKYANTAIIIMVITGRTLAHIGHDQVQMAIAVLVRYRQRNGTVPSRTVTDSGLEGTVSIAQQNADCTTVRIAHLKVGSHDHIRPAVSIHIHDRD